MMHSSMMLWVLFGVMAGVVLFIDLIVGPGRKRQSHVALREAVTWTALWMLLALAFAGAVATHLGRPRAVEFVTAYLVELSLSVDNLFVFVLIFHYFKIPALHQTRVLKYGILGAILLRFIIIFTGVELLHRFHWVFYVLAGLLCVTAVRMMLEKDETMNPAANPVLRFLTRWVPVTTDLHEDQFFITRDLKRWATPLFAALVVIEVMDLVFAVDSIPAVLAISTSTLVVFTSNIFAILGLRSLYAVISGFMSLFHFLRYGIAVILLFISAKMLLMDYVHISTLVSLAVVAGILSLSIIASLCRKEPAA